MKNIRLVVWAYLIILLLVFASLFYEAGYINTSLVDPETSAQFAAIIGGLTAPLVIYLLLETYQSQKEELKETKAIARQQASIMATQQFESAYFSMLSRHLEIVSSLEGQFPFLEESIRYKGRDYLKKAVEDMYKSLEGTEGKILSEYDVDHQEGVIKEKKYKAGKPSLKVNSTEKTKNQFTFSLNKEYQETEILQLENFFREFSEKYSDFYFHHQSFLGHYFRYIASIVSFVNENHKSFKDQKERCTQECKYIKLLQAQMSNDELGLIFYYGLSKHGRTPSEISSLWKLLDQYGLFEEISVSTLRATWHTQLYPQTRYKTLGERNPIYNKYPFSNP